jgi:hypothetical protein
MLLAACGQEAELPPVRPLADAGNDQMRLLRWGGTTIGLDGRASCDPEGRYIETFEWSFVSVPQGMRSDVPLSAGLHTSFVARLEGRYVLRLVVSTEGVESEPDEVVIELREDLAEDLLPSVPAVDRCGRRLQ